MMRSILTFYFSLFFMHSISAHSWWDLSPLDVREAINQRIMGIEAPVPVLRAVDNRVIENESRSTPVRIYLPDAAKDLPVVLLIHGGAWVAGNLDTHDNLARYICSEVQALVISIGYTNAPEGKFPLQLLQCLDVLAWIADQAHEFGADPIRLAVLGDSAGGNMAAAFCLMVRDLQGPKICMQVLINPAPDLTCNGTLIPQNDSLDQLRWQALQYLASPKEVNLAYVSPLIADNLYDLPEAMIILAENDDLREDGEKYAERLIEAGVTVTTYCQRGTPHLAGDGARASFRARESLNVAAAALRRVFAETKMAIRKVKY